MDEPIQSDRERRVVSNAWNDLETEVGRQDKAHFLTENDGIRSLTTDHQIALSCGCVAEPGGACSQCFGVVCVNCLRRCSCGAPLGPCHARASYDAQGNIIHSCPTCHTALKNHRSRRSFLSFFIRFRD